MYETIAEPKTLSKKTFGECSRFALVEFRTRFDTIEWFVDDAETPDENGDPSIVAQNSNKEKALGQVGYCSLGNGAIVKM